MSVVGDQSLDSVLLHSKPDDDETSACGGLQYHPDMKSQTDTNMCKENFNACRLRRTRRIMFRLIYGQHQEADLCEIWPRISLWRPLSHTGHCVFVKIGINQYQDSDHYLAKDDPAPYGLSFGCYQKLGIRYDWKMRFLDFDSITFAKLVPSVRVTKTSMAIATPKPS